MATTCDNTERPYTVTVSDGQCEEDIEISASDNDEAEKMAEQECHEWIEGGEWGDDGASVSASWNLCDADGDQIASGSITVDIEPNHNVLIRRAGGNPKCDHDWTSDGEGGCDENPGVWSTGGTSMVFKSHCRTCGLHKTEHTTGSQRNSGECDNDSAWNIQTSTRSLTP